MRPEYFYTDDSYRMPAYLIDPLMERFEQLRRGGAQRVLEIGCGNGNFARDLSKAGFDVTATDASVSGIATATAGGAANFHVASVYDAEAFEPLGLFDVVVAVEVIEHLQYPRELFRRAQECLAPDGNLLITTPYHGFLKNLALTVTNGWDHHFAVGWDVGHVRFFSPASMRALAHEEGFQENSWSGLGRLPGLWKSFLYDCSARASG